MQAFSFASRRHRRVPTNESCASLNGDGLRRFGLQRLIRSQRRTSRGLFFVALSTL
jgi:hypothetical protein